ncbi:putative urea ABC transporter substrate-binding protein [Aurantimonas sp. 22II-16-19i]|uniref:putative urea ABC transporter substrate-binding protein n=1 Tax=Aurantimonas sp. 22II-16-19i TaxID=1317114 RepID=UPI0009F7A498|nr:putative urea ABC transporter substrate-binding protein [Aurantimonas sp. 22II-16-19i]ORE90823.1 nitrate/sulfonate/bicarbonate ABC transporter periplasmic proteins-like protein [Aurantimonas sp. 22II-16-19i]
MRLLAAALALAATCLAGSPPASAEEKKDFSVCWSIYAGWMPWGYMEDSGLLKKWADKYGIAIKAVQINDYVESINQYTAGQYDGCTMTNMDALSIPAGGGVDTTALIIGDYSNGNDGVVLKGKTALEDIKGQRINLVELSVSHYLLARALESVDMSEKDVTVVNTSDADMVAAYQTPDVTSVVTWNPLLSTIAAMPDSHEVFNSSKIPGEILDLMVVNTETLQDNPDFGKALTGAWYEMMGLMQSDTPEGTAALEAMAEASGTDLKGFEAQLATTAMFYDPAKAVEFAKSETLPETMTFVANFLFDHGILGQGAPNADFVGIAYPGGKTTGDAGNIQLRYDPTYMEMAAEKKL